jgi:hypothetical protein
MRFPFLLAGALLATGCTESQLRLNPDFGVAARQDAAAQIANPHPRYVGWPPAGSDGSRAALAQTRYATDKVIRPYASSTADINQAPAGDTGGGAGLGGATTPQ